MQPHTLSNLSQLSHFLSRCVANQNTNGFIIPIFKSKNTTSRDAINHIQRALITHKFCKKMNDLKIGHAGTLDPIAEGVLIVAIGKSATQTLWSHWANQIKTYRFTMKIGQVTNSFDSFEPICFETDPSVWNHSILWDKEALQHFATETFVKNEVLQKVPLFSAVNQNGTRLYDKFRTNKSKSKGLELQYDQSKNSEAPKLFSNWKELHELQKDIPSKPISIYELQHIYTKKEEQLIQFVTTVSTGTYIRSLAHDMGEALGCGAHVVELIREKVGPVSIKDTFSLEQFDSALQHK